MFIDTTCTFHLIKALSTELACLQDCVGGLVVDEVEERMSGVEGQID